MATLTPQKTCLHSIWLFFHFSLENGVRIKEKVLKFYDRKLKLNREIKVGTDFYKLQD
jgi:hypothetical protein